MFEVTASVTKQGFYKALDELKQKQKRKDSQITLFTEDNFYNEAQEVLKVQTQTKQNLLSGKQQDSKGRNGPIMKVKSKPAIKNVVPKSQLYNVLTLAHAQTLQRQTKNNIKWINESYAGVSVRVVNLFVGLCRIHEEKKTITNHVNLVTKPLQSPEFLSLIKIDFDELLKLSLRLFKNPYIGNEHNRSPHKVHNSCAPP